MVDGAHTNDDWYSSSLHSGCGIITVTIFSKQESMMVQAGGLNLSGMEALCWSYVTQNLLGLCKFISGCRKAQADHNRS